MLSRKPKQFSTIVFSAVAIVILIVSSISVIPAYAAEESQNLWSGLLDTVASRARHAYLTIFPNNDLHLLTNPLNLQASERGGYHQGEGVLSPTPPTETGSTSTPSSGGQRWQRGSGGAATHAIAQYGSAKITVADIPQGVSIAKLTIVRADDSGVARANYLILGDEFKPSQTTSATKPTATSVATPPSSTTTATPTTPVTTTTQVATKTGLALGKHDFYLQISEGNSTKVYKLSTDITSNNTAPVNFSLASSATPEDSYPVCVYNATSCNSGGHWANDCKPKKTCMVPGTVKGGTQELGAGTQCVEETEKQITDSKGTVGLKPGSCEGDSESSAKSDISKRLGIDKVTDKGKGDSPSDIKPDTRKGSDADPATSSGATSPEASGETKKTGNSPAQIGMIKMVTIDGITYAPNLDKSQFMDQYRKNNPTNNAQDEQAWTEYQNINDINKVTETQPSTTPGTTTDQPSQPTSGTLTKYIGDPANTKTFEGFLEGNDGAGNNQTAATEQATAKEKVREELRSVIEQLSDNISTDVDKSLSDRFDALPEELRNKIAKLGPVDNEDYLRNLFGAASLAHYNSIENGTVAETQANANFKLATQKVREKLVSARALTSVADSYILNASWKETLNKWLPRILDKIPLVGPYVKGQFFGEDKKTEVLTDYLKLSSEDQERIHQFALDISTLIYGKDGHKEGNTTETADNKGALDWLADAKANISSNTGRQNEYNTLEKEINGFLGKTDVKPVATAKSDDAKTDTPVDGVTADSASPNE